jgi:hypothetical protein
VKKKKKLDKIVAGVLLYWILFVFVGWISWFTTGGVPDTLVQAGLGGGALELAMTAAIEILTNNRKEEKGEENE